MRRLLVTALGVLATACGDRGGDVPPDGPVSPDAAPADAEPMPDGEPPPPEGALLLDATGVLAPTCNWDGSCDPAFRFFSLEDGGVSLWFVFDVAVARATGVEDLRAALELGEATIAEELLPESEYVPCGATTPEPTLTGFAAGRLTGHVDGAVRLCRIVDVDILDDTGIDPLPFRVSFDVSFDPQAVPPR